MNLVNNAEQHAGGVTAVLVTAQDGRARVAVEDGGPGIDQRERERIFERFARGRRSGRDSTEGAGLGLSLVARHVELMGGTVTLEDVAGGGSRFIVSLPTGQDSVCTD
jgi:signal transduction histidine kinase